jgi:hypothetical protein
MCRAVTRHPPPAPGIERIDLEGVLDILTQEKVGEIFAGKESVRLLVVLKRAEHVAMAAVGALEPLVGRLISEPQLEASLLPSVVVDLAARLGAPAVPAICRLVLEGSGEVVEATLPCFERMSGLQRQEASQAIAALRSRSAADPLVDAEALRDSIRQLERFSR